MKNNYAMVWKDGAHFKLKLLPMGKKSEIKCIKKSKVQAKLDDLKFQGWKITIKKPIE